MKLTLIQAQQLLRQLEPGNPKSPVRLTIELSDEEIKRLMPTLKHLGYIAHPESSAYSDSELVITGKVKDGGS